MRDDLTVTQATAAEWDEIVAWTAGEGWNPGHGDAAHFLPSDPAGFFVGRLDGRVVSAVSVVVYSPSTPSSATTWSIPTTAAPASASPPGTPRCPTPRAG